ncbi:FhaA domain-containing protein [Tessaracoccus sp.]
MGVFDRAEKRIGAAVDKVFARAFKGDVQPVEIAAGIQRELDAEAKLLSRDKRLVPNEFTVFLSSHDHARLFPYSKTLNTEIVPGLREHARARNYVFNGPIAINYACDATLPTGQFTVSSEAVSRDTTAPTPATRRQPRALVIEVSGVRHPLVPPGLVVGRGSEADLRLNDPGVSRRHALITVTGTADAPQVSIEDLGSTNGIIVNGSRVQQAKLSDGTRIEIGSTRMLVHSPLEQ